MDSRRIEEIQEGKNESGSNQKWTRRKKNKRIRKNKQIMAKQDKNKML
jgi:hypothetical protein